MLRSFNVLHRDMSKHFVHVIQLTWTINEVIRVMSIELEQSVHLLLWAKFFSNQHDCSILYVLLHICGCVHFSFTWKSNTSLKLIDKRQNSTDIIKTSHQCYFKYCFPIFHSVQTETKKIDWVTDETKNISLVKWNTFLLAPSDDWLALSKKKSFQGY